MSSPSGDSTQAELAYLRDLVNSIRAALGTDEKGYDLVEVARAAHFAELREAAILRRLEELAGEWEEA